MDILVNSFSIKQFEKSLPSTKIISPGINSELWSIVTICVSEFDTLSINNMFCPKCCIDFLINACSPLKGETKVQSVRVLETEGYPSLDTLK